MIREQKYIILKKQDLTKEFIFPTSLSHADFANDNGFNYWTDTIESGLVIDGLKICTDGRDKNDYLVAGTVLKGRQAETLYRYGYTKEGD